ncbi:MAG: OmpH family outer membrane protein [Muribaculaceae bacterium]|nr:OmpH family outer membrane protein [Muribaculaceae bacterium]
MKKFLLMTMAIVAMNVAAQEIGTKPFTVRYIDEDKLYQQYVVAQQYVELQNKLKNDFQKAQQKKSKEIETFYNQVQNKYKKNLYKTQKAFEADQKKLEQMQEKAQKDMEAMQKSMEVQLNNEQMKLANEIDLFLADYAVKNDYDAILRKEAAMFINPKWDVTDEVAEGLNARYNAANAPATVVDPAVTGEPKVEEKGAADITKEVPKIEDAPSE